MATEKDYTLGKGKLYFQQTGQTGELFLGNCPEFNFTIAADNLDHFSSTGGIKVKDDSATLQINRTGTILCDNISDENMVLYLGASISDVTQVATAVTAEELGNVKKGYFYQLGKTTNNPQGVRNVTAVTLNKGATPLVLNTDYTLDAALGRVRFNESSVTVSDNDAITANYTPGAGTRKRIVTGSSATIEGSMRYISDNPRGKNRDWYFAKVTLRPNGDFSTIGDDWQNIGFAVEIGDNGVNPAIIVDGRPL